MLKTNQKTNQTRLWDSLMDMAKIGPGVAGGNNRQTLTDEDKQGRDLFATWCKAAGMTVSVDGMGNMFARREGTDETLPPVMMGSHLDTQPTGGKFDGVLGVLAGLEVVRTLNDMGIKTRHPIEVVNWTNEEGARFAPAMVSSGVFAGAMSVEDAYAIKDGEGKALGDELARIGYKGNDPVGGREIKAMFELHIEQGPILEQEKLDVGVVAHAQGPALDRVYPDRLSSATPAPRRCRSGATRLLGAARAVELVNSVAFDFAPNAVATVGLMHVSPNSRNIVPGQVMFCVDMRNPSLDDLKDMETAIVEGIERIADEIGLECESEVVGAYDPVAFDADCVDAVRRAAERLGYSHKDMVSGAGHDACHIAAIAPTAMIFCPCVDGVSHNEAEEISPEWAAAGAPMCCSTRWSKPPDWSSDTARGALHERTRRDRVLQHSCGLQTRSCGWTAWGRPTRPGCRSCAPSCAACSARDGGLPAPVWEVDDKRCRRCRLPGARA
jgi:N-carbamoyl-L-amino-acid hydrolase